MSAKRLAFYRVFVADGFGVALSDDEVDRVLLLWDRGVVTEWTPVEFCIQYGEWEGRAGDFVPNDLGWRLCSQRMQKLLDDLRSDADKVQWLPSYVTDLDGRRTKHFVLHFPETSDILNLEPGETIYDEESEVLIRPCISLEKAEGRRIFNIRGLQSATIVHASVKKALEESGIEGVEFHSIRQR
jgi:hypothetical protein